MDDVPAAVAVRPNRGGGSWLSRATGPISSSFALPADGASCPSCGWSSGGWRRGTRCRSTGSTISQLAVETLFGEEPAEGGDLTLTVAVVGGTFKVTLGGLSSPTGAADPVVPPSASSRRAIGRSDVLRMLMDSLVDEYRTADGTTAGSFAVEMEKRILVGVAIRHCNRTARSSRV